MLWYAGVKTHKISEPDLHTMYVYSTHDLRAQSTLHTECAPRLLQHKLYVHEFRVRVSGVFRRGLRKPYVRTPANAMPSLSLSALFKCAGCCNAKQPQKKPHLPFHWIESLCFAESFADVHTNCSNQMCGNYPIKFRFTVSVHL